MRVILEMNDMRDKDELGLVNQKYFNQALQRKVVLLLFQLNLMLLLLLLKTVAQDQVSWLIS